MSRQVNRAETLDLRGFQRDLGGAGSRIRTDDLLFTKQLL